jgi:hypothetical protein
MEERNSLVYNAGKKERNSLEERSSMEERKKILSLL